MEEKLRSYFFLGNLDNLLKYQGKKNAEASLLTERSLVMIEKPTNSELPNLEVLSLHQKDWEQVPIASDELEETLKIILNFNSSQEANPIDSFNPDTLEKKLFLACCLLKLRRHDIAETTLKSALAQDDEEGGLSLLLACTLLIKGENEEAAGTVSELISKYGESSVLLNIYALSLVHDGNYSKASSILKKALDIAKALGVRQYVEISIRNLISCKRILQEDVSELEQ